MSSAVPSTIVAKVRDARLPQTVGDGPLNGDCANPDP